MKYSFTILALLASALARPEANEATFNSRFHSRDVRAPQGAFVRPRWNFQLSRREVPQEHSHEKFVTSVRTSLNLNNPNGIVDPVFGLLGNGAAKQGLGKVTDTECLQQATADQAFTNAKAAGDITGMTNALVFRALERNTGQVGLASNSCTSITPANLEIAALAQHQDPASTNAAAVNKKITLDLAVQIASVGGDPTVALQSGTFAPGKIGDPTAAGNTCDVQTDPVGCIFTQNLLVEDATIDEVTAAVAAAGKAGGAAPAASTSTTPAAVQVVSTMIMTMVQTVTACATPVAAAAPPPGMTVITMSTADVSALMSVCTSMGISVHTGKTKSKAANTGSKAAIQTTVQVQSATATGVAAVASTSVDCSGVIASALAAANLGGPAGSASAPAASSPTFSNATTAAAAKASASSPAAAPTTGKSSLNLGSCSNPTVIFANNLDGRNQPSFAPADETTFTHGSALGIKVITDFICQQLGVKCKASAATITACNQGAAAAQGQTGQAAADAFNKALGF